LFGLAVGGFAVLIFLFGFFNEVIIAPFIQPARTQSATPLIVNADTVAPSATPQVIIPKINVQIPIQFDVTATDEATMQKDLESGVAHYPVTSNPGQNGNSAYFGHSSNNIFNKGKYKFAFVLLHELIPGDTFYITKDGKVYAYKVFDKKVVEPNQVEVLDPVPGHTATATLITCDPPGTSLKRMVIVGDQISPDVSGNTAASTSTEVTSEAELTGNGPTLWGRFIGTWAGKLALLAFVVVTFLVVVLKTRPRY
jgi:sortase A